MEKQLNTRQALPFLYTLSLALLFALLSACGFQLQGKVNLPPALQRIYLESPDPYGQLARDVKDSLKLSDAIIVNTPKEANSILLLEREEMSQQLISVNATQQTRQYRLLIYVGFEIQNSKGETLVPRQTFSESRSITIQSNQILGTSNEASMLYTQMRRELAHAIMNRISSVQIAEMIKNAQ